MGPELEARPNDFPELSVKRKKGKLLTRSGDSQP